MDNLETQATLDTRGCLIIKSIFENDRINPQTLDQCYLSILS
jgi:hypothetical protein